MLQNKVQAGTALSFTKVKIGDGQLGSGQSLEALTDLISPKKTLDISAVAVIGDGTSRVRAVVTNTGLAAGFFVREIGLFATDPDDGEILYCVANAGNECDYLPTPTSVAVEQTLDILTAIGNATNVTAVINETIVLATVADITDHNNNSDAHNLRRWKAGREYAIGDICFSKLFATESYKYFECTVAGTSGTTEPTWPATGNTVTDGGVTWIVRDLRVATATSEESTKIATSQWVKDVALLLAGGTMAGAIAMGSNKITGLGPATASGDAVSLGQFLSSIAGAQGYQKFPSGLIIQWGTVQGGGVNPTLVTFPVAYTTNLFSVAGFFETTGTPGALFASCGYVSLSQMAVGRYAAGGTPQLFGCTWIAIGY